MNNPFNSRSKLSLAEGDVTLFRLPSLADQGLVELDNIPFSIRVLLENVLRHAGTGNVSEDDVTNVAGWAASPDGSREVPYMPARVILQDFTGVPAVVDLAALRDAMVSLGGDPAKINPLVPTDLVIDHSVQVDRSGNADAFGYNVRREMERNKERYSLLKWAQQAFDNFQVVPPGTGIVHQVNLERLADVVRLDSSSGEAIVFPDTLVGTDSHTTMINGLGVMGWGVGGIEAEAVMLGQPYFMKLPEVVGMKLTGELPEGATATDLVLTVVQMLREHGVVGKFVEFFGSGLGSLTLADRATLANMAPEYGATMGFFPVDAQTLYYLERTGRSSVIERVERYCKEQNLFHTNDSPVPTYSSTVELDMGTVVPSLSGPKRPQDRVALDDLHRSFDSVVPSLIPSNSNRDPKADAPVAKADRDGESFDLTDGSIVIAAITSCTNTSNPTVMLGAGLVARNAVAKGLQSKAWVKTSMAPGSKVVTRYLEQADVLGDLEKLGFNVVGYGCTTCIGNSGPLDESIEKAITDNDLIVAAVLSGNRNFEARIHASIRANYLASPMLVVAYALAGRVDIDLSSEPLGTGSDGQPVYLKDIWPTAKELSDTVNSSLTPEMFETEYATVFEGDDAWKALDVPEGDAGRFNWDPASTYVAEPPFFKDLATEPDALADISDARVLVWLGDTTTTDHISPAGAIPKDSPAGKWLIEKGVEPKDYNTFGSRRGHHDVMMRGTFGNVRIKNRLADGKEGNWTRHIPSDQIISIFDASMKYQADDTQLVVLAGTEYGTGSSRDWAAKGTYLLGVKAVIAASYERIHRGNLIGMGVLPLQFQDGENSDSHGLNGHETFSVSGIADGLEPGCLLEVTATGDTGTHNFKALVRLDTAIEVEYYRHGGILQYVLRNLVATP
jgi:aconitate hydratase